MIPQPDPVQIRLSCAIRNSNYYDIDFLKNGVRFDGTTYTNYVRSDLVDALPSDVFNIVVHNGDTDEVSPDLTDITVAGEYRTDWNDTRGWYPAWHLVP